MLIHLRLLHISDIEINYLPDSITKLFNLQTLRIECPDLIKLLEDLSNLINLRHICIIDCESAAAPKNVGWLTCFQTLPNFCVGWDVGYWIKELGPLGSDWLEEWKSGRIENGGRMKKWEDRKDFNFSHFCLVRSRKVEGWKKWVCINLLIHPY